MFRRAFLKGAAERMASTTPGDRHGVLLREAWKLAGGALSLGEHEIRAALLPAFVAAAGEARRREGELAIRDAIRARREAP